MTDVTGDEQLLLQRGGDPKCVADDSFLDWVHLWGGVIGLSSAYMFKKGAVQSMFSLPETPCLML